MVIVEHHCWREIEKHTYIHTQKRRERKRERERERERERDVAVDSRRSMIIELYVRAESQHRQICKWSGIATRTIDIFFFFVMVSFWRKICVDRPGEVISEKYKRSIVSCDGRRRNKNQNE